jgi:hypothetical protein
VRAPHRTAPHRTAPHRAGGASLSSGSMSTTSTREDFHARQMYVDLENVRPQVWRRLLAPLTIDLSRLHVMLLWH